MIAALYTYYLADTVPNSVAFTNFRIVYEAVSRALETHVNVHVTLSLTFEKMAMLQLAAYQCTSSAFMLCFRLRKMSTERARTAAILERVR